MIRPIPIDNVLIDVPSVEQAAAWYQEYAGLAVLFTTPDIAVLHTEDHAGPGILLRRSDRPSHGTVWFEVADAQLVADAWGLPVFAVATGKCVEIHDPWGNTVGFTDYSNTHTA